MAGQVMTNKEYREHEGLSSSQIKRMAKSMAYFKFHEDNPENNDTKSLIYGRAYHKYCLEPDTFYDEFAVMPDCNCATKEGKQAYIEYTENVIGRPLTDAEKKYKDSITGALLSCGKDFISQSDFEVIDAMRTALYATPFAKKLIYGEHEKSFFWEDEESGLVCKCRPDSYGKIGSQHICVDLKTTKCAETDAFMRDAIKLGYDIQASHYCQGLKANTGNDFKFIFIAQEKTPPYLVNILEADDYFMASGKQVRAELLEQYKECLDKNEFPGYMGFSNNAEINSLGVPKWIADSIYIEESEE